jgi:hypothetical protein
MSIQNLLLIPLQSVQTSDEDAQGHNALEWCRTLWHYANAIARENGRRQQEGSWPIRRLPP